MKSINELIIENTNDFLTSTLNTKTFNLNEEEIEDIVGALRFTYMATRPKTNYLIDLITKLKGLN